MLNQLRGPCRVDVVSGGIRRGGVLKQVMLLYVFFVVNVLLFHTRFLGLDDRMVAACRAYACSRFGVHLPSLRGRPLSTR